MRMSDPEIAIANMAAAQGCAAFGPVTALDDLSNTLAAAVAEVKAGRVAVVEVITDASYPDALIAALTPEKKG
jgi:hypothetical protein